ncbi:MAG TPA: hypothetical protein VN458_05220 [Solirubrobacterales bacterium]|nr:hypothetical protein [Solirubrobacterales bacterium]
MLIRLSIRPNRSSACFYRPLRGLEFCDVTLHGEKVGLVGGADRARGGDNGVPGTTERGHQARADALVWLSGGNRQAHAHDGGGGREGTPASAPPGIGALHASRRV